jgi:hypothetical protein
MNDDHEHEKSDLSDADRLNVDLRNAVTVLNVSLQLIRRRSAVGAIIADCLLDSVGCLEEATNRLRVLADRLTK